MHESLVRLTIIITKLSADSLLPEVRLTSMVTLMVENLFSLISWSTEFDGRLVSGNSSRECIAAMSAILLTQRIITQTK